MFLLTTMERITVPNITELGRFTRKSVDLISGLCTKTEGCITSGESNDLHDILRQLNSLKYPAEIYGLEELTTVLAKSIGFRLGLTDLETFTPTKKSLPEKILNRISKFKINNKTITKMKTLNHATIENISRKTEIVIKEYNQRLKLQKKIEQHEQVLNTALGKARSVQEELREEMIERTQLGHCLSIRELQIKGKGIEKMGERLINKQRRVAKLDSEYNKLKEKKAKHDRVLNKDYGEMQDLIKECLSNTIRKILVSIQSILDKLLLSSPNIRLESVQKKIDNFLTDDCVNSIMSYFITSL